jgi:GxxExxY protein
MYSIEELKKKYDEETYKIIGAAMEVHRHLGCGFLEAVYGDALAIEFTNRNIPFEREKLINIKYKNTTLEHYYVADFVCYDSIIVELKAVTELNKTFEAQVLNYLNATGYESGLLINFGELSLKHHRIFNATKNKSVKSV